MQVRFSCELIAFSEPLRMEIELADVLGVSERAHRLEPDSSRPRHGQVPTPAADAPVVGTTAAPAAAVPPVTDAPSSGATGPAGGLCF